MNFLLLLDSHLQPLLSINTIWRTKREEKKGKNSGPMKMKRCGKVNLSI